MKFPSFGLLETKQEQSKLLIQPANPNRGSRLRLNIRLFDLVSWQSYLKNVKATTPCNEGGNNSEASAGITPEHMAEIGEPLVLATSGKTKTALILVSKNGKTTQLRSPSGIGFSVLTGTRGLDGDLMNTDVEQRIARIKANSTCPPPVSTATRS